MDPFVEEILIEYVKEQHLDRKKNAEMVIHNFCLEQKPLSITIYRGHGRSSTIRPGLWYSASSDIKVASTSFAGKDCCVFAIHLLDIPCINIIKLIGDKIGDKKDEKEIIFLGGGTFYKNKELTEEGFLEIGMDPFNKTMFECWYSLKPKVKQNAAENKKANVQRALDIISLEEYEFIESVNDIEIGIKMTQQEKQLVFEEIQKRKHLAGKKRKKTLKHKKRKKTLKHKKKHTKRKSRR